MSQPQRLSHNSVQVLQSIVAGRTYDQIITRHPHLTFLDIFGAAKEALLLNETPASSVPSVEAGDPPTPTPRTMQQAKAEHPRAYQPWAADEDEQLIALHLAGKSSSDIAATLERTPSAIRCRLVKLGWVERTTTRPAANAVVRPLDWMM